MTSTRGFMGGSSCMSWRTLSAACGPLATSKLMSKARLLVVSTNLMMGTLALAMTYRAQHNPQPMR